MRFVAVGDVMVDVVCSVLPPAGSRVHGDVSLRAGGSAINAARAAAAAGASATVVGRIGNDHPGALVAAELRGAGIEAHLARDPEFRTGIAVALAGDPGAGVVATRGANARLSRDDIPDPLEADALLVSGFALFQTGSADAARSALRRFEGPWSGVDVGSPKLAAAARDLAFGDERTVVFATADEARALTGAEPEEAARALASRFSIACVKLGPDGAVAATGSAVERRAADERPRGSPFGAGDAFAAAFLVALAAGDPVGRALEVACEAGAVAAAA